MSGPAREEQNEPSERRRLFTTFSYLVGQQGATAVLGLAYWILVSRLFPARDVGLAAAASSIAFFLAAIGALGIPILLVAEIESVEASRRRFVVTTAMAISCFAVLALSLVSLGLAPVIGNSLLAIRNDPITAALFIVGSVAVMGSATFDNAAIGLHRGSAQLIRGSLSSALKLACVGFLVLAGTKTSAGLLLAWAAALVVSLIVCVPMLRLERTAGARALAQRMELTRRYGSLSLKHYVLNLSINSISYIVPLTAALFIGPQEVAYFTAAFLLSATVLIIPYLLTLSLFAERSGDSGLLHRHVRRTLPLALMLCSAIVVIVEIGAPLVLRIFGPAYALHGTTALRLLILVGPAYVIKDHYVVIRRAQDRMTDAAKVMAIGTTAEALGAALGALMWGLTGLCVGWAIAASGEALLLLPATLQVYRRTPMASDPGVPPP